jgi:hypothetical protein
VRVRVEVRVRVGVGGRVTVRVFSFSHCFHTVFALSMHCVCRVVSSDMFSSWWALIFVSVICSVDAIHGARPGMCPRSDGVRSDGSMPDGVRVDAGLK